MPGEPAGDSKPRFLLAVTFSVFSQSILCGLFSGIVALHNALVDNNAFVDHCGPHEPRPCLFQQRALAQTFQIASTVGTFVTFPAGYIADRYGAFWLGIGVIIVTGAGWAVSGIDLHNGYGLIVGLTIASLAGNCIRSFGTGCYLVPALVGQPERYKFWSALSFFALDFGVSLAIVVGLSFDWTVMSLSAWFATFGVVLIGVFIPWHVGALRSLERAERSAAADPLLMTSQSQIPTTAGSVYSRTAGKPPSLASAMSAAIAVQSAREVERDAVRQVDDRPERRTGDLLCDRDVLMTSARMVSTQIWYNAVLATAGRTAPFFDLSPRVTIYVPIALIVAGVVLFSLALTGQTSSIYRMFALKLCLETVMFVLAAVPDLRTPTTFWIVMFATGIFGGVTYLGVMKAATMIGFGGSEGRVTGVVLTVAAVVGVPLSGVCTFFMGESSAGLTYVSAAMGVYCVVTNVAHFRTEQRLEALAEEEASEPSQ